MSPKTKTEPAAELSTDDDVDPQLVSELKHRVARIRSGESRGRPAAEVMAEVRASLMRRRAAQRDD